MGTEAVEIRAVVLAAGESSRLGRPKQLLRQQGELLVDRALRLARAATEATPLLVLGAHHTAIAAAVSQPAHILLHPGWAAGLGTTIAHSAQWLAAQPQPPRAILFLLTDQVCLEEATLQQLIQAWCQSHPPIAACRYHNGRTGVPAIFSASTYPQLMALQGGSGARSLFQHYASQLLLVPFPEGDTDVDTEADVERLQLEG